MEQNFILHFFRGLQVEIKMAWSKSCVLEFSQEKTQNNKIIIILKKHLKIKNAEKRFLSSPYQARKVYKHTKHQQLTFHFQTGLCGGCPLSIGGNALEDTAVFWEDLSNDKCEVFVHLRDVVVGRVLNDATFTVPFHHWLWATLNANSQGHSVTFLRSQVPQRLVDEQHKTGCLRSRFQCKDQIVLSC